MVWVWSLSVHVCCCAGMPFVLDASRLPPPKKAFFYRKGALPKEASVELLSGLSQESLVGLRDSQQNRDVHKIEVANPHPVSRGQMWKFSGNFLKTPLSSPLSWKVLETQVLLWTEHLETSRFRLDCCRTILVIMSPWGWRHTTQRFPDSCLRECASRLTLCC